MSTPNFQDHDIELFGLPSAGFTAGLGSPFDLDQLPLESDLSAFSPAPLGTISPKDLMNDGGSLPPSATFTDMSTPSFASPGGAFSANSSPMFTEMDALHQSPWPSLFGDEPAIEALSNYALPSLEEPAKQQMMQLTASVPPAPKRQSASKSASSPISAAGSAKPSSVAGVTRSRKELSPVAFDPSDPVAAKRARNTEAARKSRAKKLERQMTAEVQIAELKRQLEEKDAVIAKLLAERETHRQYA